MNGHQQSGQTVKGERTGWRDGHLSLRHRQWGFACPAMDLDFLMAEMNKGKAIALIEYKSEFSPEQFPSHPSYLALTDLGNRAGVPVFVVRYQQTFQWFRIIPLNPDALKILPERVEVNERLFVTWLWNLRGLNPPESIFKALESAI
jgi:hypothetical protein